MKKLVQIVCVLGLAVGLVSQAFAGQCEDVKMPDTITVNGTKLVLNGMGLREATIFYVNVYVAGLYVVKKSRNGAEISDSNTLKRLQMKFVRHVSKSDVIDAYKESFKKNAGGHYAQIKARIATFLSWAGHVKDGQVDVYTYTPSKGIEVILDGKVKGTIPGLDFAKVFFRIWLGVPPNKGLKRGLLGGTCG